jgi:hypothetical protein
VFYAFGFAVKSGCDIVQICKINVLLINHIFYHNTYLDVHLQHF